MYLPSSVNCLKESKKPPLSFNWPILSITSLEKPESVVAIKEPLESDIDTTVAPSSMTFSAVNCETFPAPEIATKVEGLERLYSGQAFAIICSRKRIIGGQPRKTVRTKDRRFTHMFNEIYQAITGGFRANITSSPVQALAGKYTSELVSELPVCPEQVAYLAAANANVSS